MIPSVHRCAPARGLAIRTTSRQAKTEVLVEESESKSTNHAVHFYLYLLILFLYLDEDAFFYKKNNEDRIPLLKSDRRRLNAIWISQLQVSNLTCPLCIF